MWLVGGGMGGTPSPYPPAGKILFIRYILVRKHNKQCLIYQPVDMRKQYVKLYNFKLPSCMYSVPTVEGRAHPGHHVFHDEK